MESTISALPMRAPNRAFGTRYGALVIDSIPPATATSISPARISWSARATAVRLDRHTLLRVMAGVCGGMPAAMAAWRAVIWPAPPWRRIWRSTPLPRQTSIPCPSACSWTTPSGSGRPRGSRGRQSAYEWAALLAEHRAERIDLVHRHDVPRFERVSWRFVDPHVEATMRVRGWWRTLPKTERDAIAGRFWEVGRLTLEWWLPPGSPARPSTAGPGPRSSTPTPRHPAASWGCGCPTAKGCWSIT